jgi:histidinol-phosphate aminotransferase
MSSAIDPLSLLRLRDPVEPYPIEESDEELAAALGLPVGTVLRFDMNTLGGGPLPGVERALRGYDPARVAEYGDQAYRALRRAIAAVTGAPEHRIVPGAGADELIRLATTMVVGAGDAVVVPVPTFPMFAVEGRLAGARVVEVPRRDPGRRQSPAELRAAVEEHGARLAWLCTPNNPTADLFEAEEVAALADGLPAIVVVDAVYQEFAEASLGEAPESRSLLPLQERLSNLLILRSLAKSYGLAGARIGYLIVPDALAARFDAGRLPLAVGGVTEALALAALDEPDAARERHRRIVEERDGMAGRLRGIGWEVLPSVTNFLLVRPPDATNTAAALLRRGMVVRSYLAGPLAGWLRITVRDPEANARLLAAIERPA